MHATTEQLLTLRDGGPGDALIQAHVADCTSCRLALDSLGRVRAGLRSLAPMEPPRDLWGAVAVGALPQAVRPRPWAWPALVGLAAGFVLGLALILDMGWRAADRPAPGSHTDRVASTPAPARSLADARQAELMAASQQLEAALHALPAAPRVTRTGMALTLDELHERIVEIDLLLEDPWLDEERSAALWSHRVQLMNTLMQVRFAQLRDGR